MRNKRKDILLVLLIGILLSACGDGGEKTGFDAAPEESNVGPGSPQVKADMTEAIRRQDEPSSGVAEETPAPAPKSDSFSVAEETPAPVPKGDSSSAPVTEPPSETGEGDNLEIGEKMFLTQINDMYYNFDDYKDKTIIVEGMYARFYTWDGSGTTPVVYRNGPGCCGNDGWGGFLLKYDGEYPNENDWIRVTGTPELVEDGSYLNLYLNVTSLEIKTERGAEFVEQ